MLAAAPLLMRPLTAVFVSATAWSIRGARSPAFLDQAIEFRATRRLRLDRSAFRPREAVDHGYPPDEVLGRHSNESLLLDRRRKFEREAQAVADQRQSCSGLRRGEVVHLLPPSVHEVALLLGGLPGQAVHAHRTLAHVLSRRLAA